MSVRAVVAIIGVVLGLIVSGLPAQAEPVAPKQPPVIPAPSPVTKTPTAPPVPAGSVPARAKAGEEIIDRRTERSKTFATDKAGQYRTELYAERVHFRDASGTYKAIDSELGVSAAGKRQSKANSFTLELADDANATTVANLRLDDAHSVGFGLSGAKAIKASTSSKVSTYPGARSGVDVKLTSRPDGLKEELVLSSAAAGDRFVFPLQLKGLTASVDAGGDVVYRDAEGNERARTPHGFMTDSAVDPRSGEVPTSRGVAYALIAHAKETALEVRLDRAWLDDPARVWPVIVDPQIAVATFADDTYVMSGFHADYSHDLELKVGTYDGGAHVGRSYMKFDTSAINSKTVNWAQLHIAERHSWNCSSAWPTVHRVTGGWNGAAMQDWPGATFDANPVGGVISANGSCNGRTVVYDVTSAAAYWATNPSLSHGLALNTSSSDNNAWKKFASSETGAPPALHVNWSDPPPPPSGNAFGYLEGVYPVVGGVRAIGWAMDPDTAMSPIYVHAYIDNNVFIEALLAKVSRTDVGAAIPGYGNNHGFDDFVPMSAGSHYVCVYAINVGAGTSGATSTGCRTVVVPARGPNEPIGLLDAVTPVPGGAYVGGWTLDPDTVSPITVQVWSDVGYVTTFTASDSRPDVGNLYPGYGNNHGFNSFANLPPGYHNVCAFAINTAVGTNHPLLGCRQVNIGAANPPAAPTNAVATINNDRNITVGWTPSASNGGSPIDFHVAYAYNAATATYAERYEVVYTATCGATCASTTFTGLPGDKSYYFVVYAHNGSPTNNGFSPATTSPTATGTVPGVPTALQATSGALSALLSWTAPPSNGADLTKFDLTAIDLGGGPALQMSCSGACLTSNSSLFTGLTAGHSYRFTASATNAAGTGPVSSPVDSSGLVLPASALLPTQVAAGYYDDERISVTWQEAAIHVPFITKYVVRAYLAPSPADGGPPPAGTPAASTVEVASPATSLVVAGLTNGTAYYATVEAQTLPSLISSGQSPSSNTITAAGKPSVPTGVTVVFGDTAATVNWTAPADHGNAISGYFLKVFTSANQQLAFTQDVAASPATVTGLTNGTAYYVSIAARNAVGTGPESAASTGVTPAGRPFAPTDISAVAGHREAMVSWQAAGSNGNPLTGYRVIPSPPCPACQGLTAPANAASTTVSGLHPGDVYTFGLAAINGVGESNPFSSSNSVTIPPEVPSLPTNVRATATDFGGAIVTWDGSDENGSAMQGYTISASDGSTMTGLASQITFANLPAGAEYTFSVVATNGIGDSAPGTSNTITTADLPSAPTAVSVTTDFGQATVSWTPAASNGSTVFRYTVYRDDLIGVVVDGSSTTATITGLSTGRTYAITVVATNAIGYGPPSDSINATPPAPKYVVLGDSYSAGDGVGTYDDPPTACKRSPLAYGPVFANNSVYAPLDLTMLACTGDKISDVYTNQLAQIPADADLISLTIGGNDVGFASILQDCLIFPACNESHPEVDDKIVDLRQPLIDVYTAVKTAAPNAEIFVLTYPSFLSASVSDCGGDLGISSGEKNWIIARIAQLDGVILSAASEAGVSVVPEGGINGDGAFAGHEVCTSEPFVNGTTPSDPTGSFHPTLLGYLRLAESLKAAVGW